MKAAANVEHGMKGIDLLAPLFGEAWPRRPLDLMSDEIKSLAATGMLNPRGLKTSEIQTLAAAVMAHVASPAR